MAGSIRDVFAVRARVGPGEIVDRNGDDVVVDIDARALNPSREGHPIGVARRLAELAGGATSAGISRESATAEGSGGARSGAGTGGGRQRERRAVHANGGPTLRHLNWTTLPRTRWSPTANAAPHAAHETFMTTPAKRAIFWLDGGHGPRSD